MAIPSDASSITVAVRVRPFTIREAAQISKCEDGPLFLGDGSLAGAPTPKLNQKGIRSIIKVIDDRCLVFDPPEDNPVQKFSKSVVPNGKRVKDQTFAFDRIFDQNASQGEVYEATTRTLLDSVLDGYNATVFAYGATGCGKTHTITGTAQQPGIIFMTMQELFERIDERSGEKATEISLSYLEIYNETIRDLLVPGGSKGGLMLREDSNKSVSVSGLSSHHPQSVQQVMDMIMKGNECRTMSPTEANATSSRSHAVLQINVAQKDRNADVNEPHTMATLSIIDLAGSERASATKNRGERLFEGANINKSLLALGSCINALCDPRKRNHVPYRNSKLTRLLKFALGGNCKTVMIVCVSPSSQHFDETQNTLRYANRAKNIQTKVTRNVFNVNRHVKDFLVKIDEQMNLINELKAQQKDHERIAFAKFKKQTEKKDAVVREGISRIRNAYEHSLPERQERTANMIKSRQISRRIGMLSSWIAAFDSVCANSEHEEPLTNLQAIRKTAQGVLLELESSRQHYHQRLSRSTWDRGINSAVEHAVRQLQDFGINDNSDLANLHREAELLKSNTERDAFSAVAEQEKGGEAETVQLLLQAQFEAISAIEDIMQMSEEEAVETGKNILSKMLDSCSTVTSSLVKPDGSLPPAQTFSPFKAMSPKPKKRVSLAALPAGKTLAAPISLAPAAPASPGKGSPRRRRLGVGRKSVTFSPKKSQAKSTKRSVRWKDDEQDGSLAEFQKTPQKPRAQLSPEGLQGSPNEPPLPRTSPVPRGIPVPSRNISPSYGSSPVPAPPEPTLHVPKNNRFKAGFLSKKTSGSPIAPPPSTSLPASDGEHSPLRNIENSSFLNRAPIDRPSRIAVRTSSGSYTSSPASDNKESWKANKDDAMRISSAMRRISGGHFGAGASANSLRVHRRRSPGSATYGSSPPENTMFTAQARRMAKGEKEHETKPGVLGPRNLPIMKNTGRRTTFGGDIRPRDISLTSRDAIRLSAMATPILQRPPESLYSNSGAGWR
ncbi:P-loop containing nucleoside triphosphate hydrolase protein [Aspergillus pseudonomiae]|uniref:P-loop containing nucleoside triphosphate hydrolase protein n=1 Tax=Aspergillus pseudonomiae TaxID=1506151 RepID=A0A5N7DR17_9EURO|nr:P-loop containing nucleoside triphosphate hydrolase protein [Aspergillus pseudonomiae]KAB8258984.1 P-loop containing nucleoside triphosphate hydrolase protein [Aspergillus pseudonomiae]KAE8407948.1 P-loop containing nucleoside triphosphate hydrolase protein [Aspergillus pseudonomiae]